MRRKAPLPAKSLFWRLVELLQPPMEFSQRIDTLREDLPIGATPHFERLQPKFARPILPPTISWVENQTKLEKNSHSVSTRCENSSPIRRLTVIQPEQVRRNNDVFRCDKFEANIRARVCLTRQYTVRALRKARGASRARLGPRTQFQACEECSVGEQIQKRVVPTDKGQVLDRVKRTKEGRLPKRFKCGPDRD